MKKENSCLVCGRPIGNRQVRYCSGACRMHKQKTIREASKKYAYPKQVCAATIGAYHELIVAADLMRRGYGVFRAMSSACPCDLAILYLGRLFRIEVTTGHSYGGSIIIPPHKVKDKHKYDILAVVESKGEDEFPGILYHPALDEVFKNGAMP